MDNLRKLLLILLMLSPVLSVAQPGISEMQEAQQSLTQSFFSTVNCSLVIAGFFGICGALRIYHNIQMGHPRMDQQVAAWLFAAFFMVLAGVFLQATFGI